tara:strand:- start:1857 stop:2570 length:714 start_codon:yes stop_codon:yes gene_type:complete
MSVNYSQLKDLVREAMFTGGGINEPSAPEGVPHRMPAADTRGHEQNMGDPKANALYEVALIAREATEQLVEALDDPIYDGAYEHAFKASASLRKALNSLEESGAHPMPDQRVVAPPQAQQKYTGGGVGDYYGSGSGTMALGLEEAEDPLDPKLGSKIVTKGQQATATTTRGKAIRSGDTLGGVDNKERGILQQIEQALTDIAEKDNLLTYRPQLQAYIKNLLRMSHKNTSNEEGINK